MWKAREKHRVCILYMCVSVCVWRVGILFLHVADQSDRISLLLSIWNCGWAAINRIQTFPKFIWSHSIFARKWNRHIVHCRKTRIMNTEYAKMFQNISIKNSYFGWYSENGIDTKPHVFTENRVIHEVTDVIVGSKIFFFFSVQQSAIVWA